MRNFLLFTLLFSGLALSAQNTITDTSKCSAFFEYEIDREFYTLLPSTAINFFDRSEGEVSEWLWDFGDGNTSDLKSPMFVFNYPVFPDGALVKINPYRVVTLTIKTTDGCSSSYSDSINIYDDIYSEPTCRSAFKYQQTGYDSIGGTASFKLNDYSEGESLRYFWKFDNGKTSTEAEPEVTFDLSKAERKVCLTVTGANGCEDTFCDPLYVLKPEGGGSSEPSDTGINCFVAYSYVVNYNVQTYAPSLSLSFYSKIDDEVVKYLWDFGDGTTSNEPNPMHNFSYPTVEDSILGDPNPFRTVCLTVTTASGCESSYCETIDIYMDTVPYDKGCNFWFNYFTPEDAVSIPEVVVYKFVASSEKEIVKWDWVFGDGSSSSEAEPIKKFDIFTEKQDVCLTITTADSCSSSWCETVYLNQTWIDTSYYEEPVCNYKFKFTSSYPETASACIGKATAQVVLNDSVVKPDYIYWSTGVESAEVTNLCPTETYTVTALVENSCKFSSSFIFNSDGTINEVPINWWIIDWGENSYIEYDLSDSSYTAEWVMCDGSVFYGDSIPLDQFNCESSKTNLVLRDAAGNVVYSDNVEIKTSTSVDNQANKEQLRLYPNPVGNVLNLSYSGKLGADFSVEIADVNGRVVLKQEIKHWQNGQSAQIEVTSLQKGLFLAKVIKDNKVVAVERFVK